MTTHGEFMQWLSNNIEVPPSRFYSKPGERAEWVYEYFVKELGKPTNEEM